ncbi:MAG: AAA family ATPase [Candidatus Dependentiae bacterium]
MKKSLVILLSLIITNTMICHGNLNDPNYYQCWEEESYTDYQNHTQEFKGKIFEEFNKFVDCVNNKTGKCNKGFILHGPAGNGKSTIATDFAKKIQAFTLRITGSVEGPYTGTNTERLDRLFEHAKHLAQYDHPVVIVIDELDALLRSTNNSNDSHADYQAKTVGHFLKLLDSLPKDNSVTVIGTTNFLKSLDSRIRRGKRLEEVEIGNPNDADRKEILRHYFTSDKINLSDKMLDLVVKKTKGFCSADLQQLVNEIAIKQSNQAIDDNIVKSELDRAIKNHKKYEAHVSEEAARRRKQDDLLDLQLKTLRRQNIQTCAAIGGIIGAAVGVGITAIYFPPALPFVAAKLSATAASAGGVTVAATTTATTFSTAVPGGIAAGFAIGSAGGAGVGYYK